MNVASGEFSLIQRYFAAGARQHLDRAPLSSLKAGIGDDCAIVQSSSGVDQVISIDTSIAGRHFPVDACAADIGYRALAVAVSDLAAMGATPRWFTLAISLTDQDDTWLAGFAKGLFEAAAQFDIALIGGDTTRLPATGAVTISVQVAGDVPSGEALQRNAARVGDTVYVTGALGDAGAGLALYFAPETPAEANWRDALLRAYLRPVPQIAMGQQLRPLAHACIDISDGLLADLGHVLAASDVGARICLDRLPLSSALQATFADTALTLAATAGDDYQLCFSSPLTPDQFPLDGVIAIGYITAEPGLQIVDERGAPVTLAAAGFDHFANG